MKSLVQFHFGSKVPHTGVPVMYLQVDPIFSTDAVTLIDTSDIVAQNSFFRQDTVLELDEENLTYFVDKRGFFITNRFGNTGVPLYYRHKIQKDIFVDENSSSDIVVVDKDGNEVDSALYYFSCGKGVIYHALSPSDDVYFVVYPRTDENNNIIEPRYKELLEAHPTLEAADASDIIECGLDPDADAYVIDELDGQPHFFRLTLPRPDKYSLRYTNQGLLRIIIPKDNQKSPWYVDIQDAVVLTNHITQNTFLRYAVSEFNQQAFYPFPPIKIKTGISAQEIEEGVLDLGFQNIVITNKTPVNVKIYNANDKIVRALTTDSNKSGRSIDGIYWETDGIVSVDESNGRIKIHGTLWVGEYATASFFYKTDRYTYTGWNFNPSFNADALTKRIALLVKPDATDCFNSLSHVVISDDQTLDSATDPDIQSWIDEDSKTLNDLIQEWTYIPGTSETNLNNYLMLGLLSTHTSMSPANAKTYDARRRGGGIIESLLSEALQIMPGAHNNWDLGHFDGPRTPIHGAVLVYLPERLLSIYTEDQLRKIASKYSAAGTYIVLRYYS